MRIADVALITGGMSSLIFIAGGMPMLYKAWCTRNLKSYSPLSLALSTAGNALYWLYVISLPLGPIWFLHGFWTVANGLMLVWYLRYRNARPRSHCFGGKEIAEYQGCTTASEERVVMKGQSTHHQSAKT